MPPRLRPSPPLRSGAPHASAAGAAILLRPIRERRGALLALLATLSPLGGCGSAPPAATPLTPPAIETVSELYPGSVLTGVRRSTDAVAVEDFVRLDVALYFVARMPGSMEPLAPHLDAIVDVGEEGVLQPSPKLAADARIATAANARALEQLLPQMGPTRISPLGRESFYLAVGTAAGLRGRRTEPVENVTHGPRRESVALVLDRTGAGHRLALEVEGLDPDDESIHLTRELLVLDVAPELDGDPVALALPSPFVGGEGAFVAVASLARPTLEADYEAIAAQVREQLDEAADRARAAVLTPDAATATLRDLRHAASGLTDLGYERDTLAHMAAQGEAPLAQDLATVADQDLLMAWGKRAKAGLPDDPSGLAPQPQAWVVERAAWAELGERLDQDRLAPYLRGMLARHGGEVGRFPGILGGLLKNSTDCADFARRLREENIAFLSTSDPSARLRAFDWLQARGAAPEGFEPMADRDARRAALRAFEEARRAAAEAAQATGSGAPKERS